MEKFSQRITNLNKVSKNILKYGLTVICIAFIFSNILMKSADSIVSLNLAREFTVGIVYALCEVVFGAVLIDMLIVDER